MKSLSSLPQGFLSSYLRSQSDPVKSNVYKALGVFPFATPEVNSGKGNNHENKFPYSLK
jgi:hypothetical protein